MPLESSYFEAYDDLLPVDLNAATIEKFTPGGIKTGEKTDEFGIGGEHALAHEIDLGRYALSATHVSALRK